MKRLIIILTMFVTLSPVAMAQEEGIHFFKGNWEEAIKTAKKEKKKIFIDFYTEWCGPCLNMALNTFVRPDVGYTYNNNFICLKIDAEKGEGIELAKKYEVRSYPTYVWIDPSNEKIVHRSGGNKPAADFIADAQGATNPKLSSFYIEEKYKSGKYDQDFLISYIKRKKLSGDRQILTYFDELMKRGNTLEDAKIWDVFSSCITGYQNPYIKQVSDNYSKFVALHGKKAVDEKLKEATLYAPAEFTQSLTDFEGKYTNLSLAELNTLFRANKYDEAFNMINRLTADSKMDQKALVRSLSFSVRVNPKYREDETPYDLLVQKVKYLRYIAYNNYDRDDAMVHYQYAVALEYLMKRAEQEGQQIPSFIFQTPENGKSEYDMRHPLLKAKPKRKA